MASTAKRKSKADEEFIIMGRTRAMLAEMWSHWRDTLGHTPVTAKRMMDAAITEMHKTEMEGVKKAKKTAKSAVKKAAKKKTAVTRKIKTAKRKIAKA